MAECRVGSENVGDHQYLVLFFLFSVLSVVKNLVRELRGYFVPAAIIFGS